MENKSAASAETNKAGFIVIAFMGILPFHMDNPNRRIELMNFLFRKNRRSLLDFSMPPPVISCSLQDGSAAPERIIRPGGAPFLRAKKIPPPQGERRRGSGISVALRSSKN